MFNSIINQILKTKNVDYVKIRELLKIHKSTKDTLKNSYSFKSTINNGYLLILNELRIEIENTNLLKIYDSSNTFIVNTRYIEHELIKIIDEFNEQQKSQIFKIKKDDFLKEIANQFKQNKFDCTLYYGYSTTSFIFRML